MDKMIEVLKTKDADCDRIDASIRRAHVHADDVEKKTSDSIKSVEKQTSEAIKSIVEDIKEIREKYVSHPFCETARRNYTRRDNA
jgi:gas vesicle protein